MSEHGTLRGVAFDLLREALIHDAFCNKVGCEFCISLRQIMLNHNITDNQIIRYFQNRHQKGLIKEKDLKSIMKQVVNRS